MMNHALSTLSIVSVCSLALAQSPADVYREPPDLPHSMPSVFDVTGRCQQFLAPDVVGLVTGVPQTLHGISLRYDAPTASSASSAGAVHTLASLVIRVGATARTIDTIGAVFDDNLTQPLTTAFAAIDYVIPADRVAAAGPEPWGAAGGALRFVFPTPISMTIPKGGSLVVEFEVVLAAGAPAGNSQLDYDGGPVSASAVAGTSLTGGSGCGGQSVYPQMAAAQVTTNGQYDVGTAFSVTGAGFAPNVPIATWWTALLGPTIVIPGTPGCWSYLDFGSGDLLFISMADVHGVFGGDQPPVPIPPTPGLSGALLYLQSAGATAPSAMNPAGLQTSNYRTIKIGCRAPGQTAWHVSRSGSTSEPVATSSVRGTLALLIE